MLHVSKRKLIRMAIVVKRVQEKTSSALQEQLKVVLWMAKEDIAPSKICSLLSLMKEASCPLLEKAATYTYQDSVKEMEEALVGHQR